MSEYTWNHRFVSLSWSLSLSLSLSLSNMHMQTLPLTIHTHTLHISSHTYTHTHTHTHTHTDGQTQTGGIRSSSKPVTVGSGSHSWRASLTGRNGETTGEGKAHSSSCAESSVGHFHSKVPLKSMHVCLWCWVYLTAVIAVYTSEGCCGLFGSVCRCAFSAYVCSFMYHVPVAMCLYSFTYIMCLCRDFTFSH